MKLEARCSTGLHVTPATWHIESWGIHSYSVHSHCRISSGTVFHFDELLLRELDCVV